MTQQPGAEWVGKKRGFGWVRLFHEQRGKGPGRGAGWEGVTSHMLTVWLGGAAREVDFAAQNGHHCGLLKRTGVMFLGRVGPVGGAQGALRGGGTQGGL